MNTSAVCERYSEQSVGLSLKMLEEEDGTKPTTVLIEGTPQALRMLAELLLAVVEETSNNEFHLSPFGPGKFHFSPSSELGFYIHRLP